MKGARLLSRAELDLVEMTSQGERWERQHVSRGVHVTPEFTEVTNGHILVRLPKPDADPNDYPKIEGTEPDSPDDVILPAEALKGWKIPKANSLPILAYLRMTSHNGTVDLASTDLEIARVNRVQPLEGVFPNTNNVIPRDRKPAFAFSPKELKLIVSWAIKHGVKSLTFHPAEHPDTEAMLITGRLEDGREATIVLMPIRL